MVKLDLNHKFIAKAKSKLVNKTNSVDEVVIVNLIQFLKPAERINFVNELWRVMKKGAKCQIVAPHWCASRAWGDLAFEFPPVAEPWFSHLNKEWRAKNAPWGTRYKCDFDHTYGYGMHPLLINRNQEYQHDALQFHKEAAQDLIATLIKR